jgi:hypothetical protein
VPFEPSKAGNLKTIGPLKRTLGTTSRRTKVGRR